MRDVVLKAGMDGNFINDVSVLLGCAGESDITRLLFNLPLIEGNYYIDFELSNGQRTKDILVENGEFWEYIIPYPVMENVGIGSLQVVVNSQSEVSDVIWKTVMLATKVQASVNATDSIANEHKDILDQINVKIIGLEDAVSNKADQQSGKGLSSNDYTNDEKQKLASLHNYDDTAVKTDITALQSNKVDKVAGKGLSANDYTSIEKTKLSNITGINTGDQDISNLMPLSQKGAVNGVATLNTNGKVVQMPNTQKITTIVSNSNFTTQPTINGGGNLDVNFELWTTNFYYVTLKDVAGSALPIGQFKLTATIDGYATAVNQIFLLTSLATGNSGTLAENTAVDFSTIGISFKMRLRYITSVSIDLTGNLQFNDIQIYISGMINTTNYLYVKLAPFNDTNYIMKTSTVTADGAMGFRLNNLTGQTKKFIFNICSLNLLRKTKDISAFYQYTHIGSDTLVGSVTATTATQNAILFSKSQADINTTAINNVNISGVNMQFANGTEITIKEII